MKHDWHKLTAHVEMKIKTGRKERKKPLTDPEKPRLDFFFFLAMTNFPAHSSVLPLKDSRKKCFLVTSPSKGDTPLHWSRPLNSWRYVCMLGEKSLACFVLLFLRLGRKFPLDIKVFLPLKRNPLRNLEDFEIFRNLGKVPVVSWIWDTLCGFCNLLISWCHGVFSLKICGLRLADVRRKGGRQMKGEEKRVFFRWNFRRTLGKWQGKRGHFHFFDFFLSGSKVIDEVRDEGDVFPLAGEKKNFFQGCQFKKSICTLSGAL